MSMPLSNLRRAFAVSLLLAMVLPPAVSGQTVIFSPERFGVIDAIPNYFSGEADQNSEPSLAIGTGKNYGKFMIHAFDNGGYNYYYTTAGGSGFALPWTSPGDLYDFDATLDWGSAGTCYAALLTSRAQMLVLTSPDPTAMPFSTIDSQNLSFEDQPWIRVVNVTNTDHIFVGFNNLSDFPAPSASIHYSLDGGSTWDTTLIERQNPGYGQDSPAVRLAISKDGKTVYSLFQRYDGFTNNYIDLQGDVVLVRDDGYGADGFGALGNGTQIASAITMPGGFLYPLGFIDVNLVSACDVAINPSVPSQVYVVYTELVSIFGVDTAVLRLQSSSDSGANFSLLCSITNASLPSLAVAGDGTVGLLYLSSPTEPFIQNEVHFLKALSGHFDSAHIVDRTLAKIRTNDPGVQYWPWLGDYFTLKAVNFDFFGTFCASDDPRPDDFPSGVFFQRNVLVGGTVMNNFWLASPGTLTDVPGQNSVAPSIDPFFFYDIASSFTELPILIRHPFFYDPIDPLSGITHMTWPELPQNEPQFQLFTSSTLDAAGSWGPAVNTPVISTNGQFEAALGGSQREAFFRLQQNTAGSLYQVFAAAGEHGSLEPLGVSSVPAMGNLLFTANANNEYAVSQWYLDGSPVQLGGSTLALSNILSEHTVLATFVASNDLAVGIEDIPFNAPTETSGTNYYHITIVNAGLNPLTNITMTNQLPGTIAFISDSATQGTIAKTGAIVTADIGSLAPAAYATVDITFTTPVPGTITDTVNVACSQMEPDLSNNTATDVTTVIDPVTITNQPAPQTVSPGGTAAFVVSVSGTPPFAYQWFFNGSNYIAGATNSILTLTNVSASQAGFYSVAVFQLLGGPEAGLEADSDEAALTVGSGPPPVRVIHRKSQNPRITQGFYRK